MLTILDPWGHDPWPKVRLEVILPYNGDIWLAQGPDHMVGLDEGRNVGDTVNFDVGLNDGRDAGFSEGNSEGLVVGFIVGLADGRAVGEAVRHIGYGIE